MNAQDPTLQGVTWTRFWLGLSFCGAQVVECTILGFVNKSDLQVTPNVLLRWAWTRMPN